MLYNEVWHWDIEIDSESTAKTKMLKDKKTVRLTFISGLSIGMGYIMGVVCECFLKDADRVTYYSLVDKDEVLQILSAVNDRNPKRCNRQRKASRRII